jgi:predicted dehydrogenase
MLRAGIVGLGLWGQRLVASSDGSPLIRFTAAVTRTPDKAADFARARNLPLGSDYAALLADPAIDAVVLATPHSQHAEQVIQAAAAGKHIFVEKPFTLDIAEAEAAVDATRRAGVVLALGHNRRFLPAIHELKRLIDAGVLGEILHAEGNISAPAGYRLRPGGWRATAAESPAGGMTGLGIHVVDALIHLAGGIAQVTAQSFRRVLTIELDDTTAMLFRFKSGASGALVTLTATAPIWRLQIFGSKGWAEMRGETRLEIALIDGKPSATDYPVVDKERAELEAFARAVAGVVPYPLPPDEAIHGVAVLEAIIRSAKTGASVAIA